MLGNVETTLQILPFEKKYKPPFKNKIIFSNFKEYWSVDTGAKHENYSVKVHSEKYSKW